MKKSCLYFDKKYKCVSFIVHYKGLTLMRLTLFKRGEIFIAKWWLIWVNSSPSSKTILRLDNYKQSWFTEKEQQKMFNWTNIKYSGQFSWMHKEKLSGCTLLTSVSHAQTYLTWHISHYGLKINWLICDICHSHSIPW